MSKDPPPKNTLHIPQPHTLPLHFVSLLKPPFITLLTNIEYGWRHPGALLLKLHLIALSQPRQGRTTPDKLPPGGCVPLTTCATVLCSFRAIMTADCTAAACSTRAGPSRDPGVGTCSTNERQQQGLNTATVKTASTHTALVLSRTHKQLDLVQQA